MEENRFEYNSENYQWEERLVKLIADYSIDWCYGQRAVKDMKFLP